MIQDLPSTSTRAVTKELLRLRNDVGAMAMGRVLTLLVAVGEDDADQAIAAANEATRQHPARILVLVSANSRGKGRLDAQIRIGGDAGASEIVVLRLFGELSGQPAAVVTPLLLPDSPIVTWWPADAPSDVGSSPLGQMSHRRITDAAAAPKRGAALRRRGKNYLDGDTDLAWTRVTRWRALLAAALEGAPYEEVEEVHVTAEADEPSADLLAGWLAASLGARVTRVRSAPGSGLVSVRLDRASGPIDLVRTDGGGDTATLSRPDTLPRLVALHTLTLADVLAEELRRLDADEVYARALCVGLPLVRKGASRSEAVRDGKVPDGPADVDIADRDRFSSSEFEGAPPSDQTDTDELRELVDAELAAARKADLRVYPDAKAVSQAVVDELLPRVQDVVRARGICHVVLTGGSMGTAVMAALGSRARAGELDRSAWRKVHLWWGDERFVPAGDPDRTDGQADEVGLSDLPVLKKNVHRVAYARGEDPARLATAAADYATELAAAAANEEAERPADAPAVPAFDVLMLGVGPDAHVASLFPGRRELSLTSTTTAPVENSPKPPPLRVTMTLPALNFARAVWFVVAGDDKAEAVRRALATRDDHQVPASCVRGRSETIWWTDEAAGGR
ncbi:MAG: 6-phosphogluconolactonase [Ornithinimicrobium sp.]|uniref:6-phosphogluconolactonase n=1 Tax=Ornithinimicrobium sp. TaxID=1977084 RepID=UPI0026DFCD1A|nr:6-phosphogluconolactonase [Ornithinimicrobium sp.]MDO5738672.1 6-phosphogluconolactonase [Ornithinimicrobium sp.]